MNKSIKDISIISSILFCHASFGLTVFCTETGPGEWDITHWSIYDETEATMYKQIEAEDDVWWLEWNPYTMEYEYLPHPTYSWSPELVDNEAGDWEVWFDGHGSAFEVDGDSLFIDDDDEPMWSTKVNFPSTCYSG